MSPVEQGLALGFLTGDSLLLAALVGLLARARRDRRRAAAPYPSAVVVPPAPHGHGAACRNSYITELETRVRQLQQGADADGAVR
ncbi:hypothetical protein [Streptacidiphilus sp. EB103A]|uniref:hypothetical protein n=1 Tax=Streptacidiphilus sp. EB103A TaxID=3156275 RepID=UPI003511E2FC